MSLKAMALFYIIRRKTSMIKIKKSQNADNRTSTGNVSKEDLLRNSVQHIGDVQKAMGWFANQLIEIGTNHDHTKISGIDDFYDDFQSGITGDEFKAKKWFQSHMSERHHLNDNCPEDVTLFDVLERIADIAMAGIGRSGSVYDATLDAEILQKAYTNTVVLLTNQIEVEEN